MSQTDIQYLNILVVYMSPALILPASGLFPIVRSSSECSQLLDSALLSHSFKEIQADLFKMD